MFQRKKMRQGKKCTSEVSLTKGVYMTFNENQDWILPILEQFNDSCTVFQKQLDKIKLISSSQSKSLKYVISKMEEVVSTHKTELGHTLKSLTNQYTRYVKNKLKVEEKKKLAERGQEGDLNEVVEPKVDSDNVDSDDHSAKRVRTCENEAEDSKEENDKSYTDNSNYAAKMLLLHDSSERDLVEETSKFNGKSSGVESLPETTNKKPTRTSLSSSEWDAYDQKPKKQKTKKPSMPLTLDYDDPKLKFQCFVGLERCDNLLLNGETTIPLPVKFISDNIDGEISNLCQLPKKKSHITPQTKPCREKKIPAPKKADDGESSSSIGLTPDEDGSQKCDNDSLKSYNDKLEEEWSSPSEASEADEWRPFKKKPPMKKINSKKAKILTRRLTPKATSMEDNISEYEKMILMNKEKSLAFLKSLNMEEVKENFCEGVRNLEQKPERPIVKKVKRSPSLPCRKSSRIVDKDLDLSEEAFEKRYKDVKPDIVKRHEELPKFLKFEETFKGSNRFCDFINDFSGLNYEENETYGVPPQFKSMKYKFKIGNFSHAVSAVTIHPDRNKIIISVGSVKGQLCFYNMNSSNSYMFHPHCKRISNLKFNPYDSTQILSSSYDGRLRYGDMEKHVFDEVHKANERNGMCTYFDILSKTTFIVAESNGNVAVVDNRRSKKTVTKYHPCNDCIVRSVCVHPLEKNYFISSDVKGFIMLWDLRKLRKQPVLKLGHHSKSVTSAFFSPVTGKSILSTSMDNSLCIFDSSNLTAGIYLKKVISHDNHLEFKAIWAPNSEDTFAMGSLLYPRRVEIFEDNGNTMYNLMDEDFISISIHQAFHPSLAVLASGDQSGNLCVFTDGV